MKYVRVTKHLEDFGILVPENEVYDNISDPTKDWYRSVYYYNETHYSLFKETNSVAGITDVFTDNIVFDFDSETNVDLAKTDTIEMVSRLITKGIKQDQMTICFSGQKGFSIEIKTTSSFSPKELKQVCKNLAEGLSTFDTKVYNSNRIFRIPLTRHNKSGLYKIPITLNQLIELKIDDIKELAVNPDNGADWIENIVELSSDVLALRTKVVVDNTPAMQVGDDLDMALKPKWISPCKYAILNGYFKAGNRNNALMALAATIKSQGLHKAIAYRMLKGAAELQANRYNQDRFPDEEIYNNIIEVVYSTTWNGATYSCKDHEFLQEVCPVKNTNKCHMNKKTGIVQINEVSDVFTSYAKNIDKNTIKTGIKSLDDNMRMLAGTHVVLAGAAGSGKTSIALNILQNTSQQGLISLFGSSDMGTQLIYQKIAQRVSNIKEEHLFQIYKNDKEERAKIDKLIAESYSNVKFDFRRGPNIEEIRATVLDLKNQEPDRFKLFLFDYIGKISGPYSDDTANMAYIAPRLADIADEAGVCLVSLAQVSRNKGGPDTPFYDHRVAKGSGAIEESATIVLGCWRPGYNTEHDKFMTVAGLKMRMGKEFKVDLGFNGGTSQIYELDSDEIDELEMLRESKKEDKSSKSGW